MLLDGASAQPANHSACSSCNYYSRVNLRSQSAWHSSSLGASSLVTMIALVLRLAYSEAPSATYSEALTWSDVGGFGADPEQPASSAASAPTVTF